MYALIHSVMENIIWKILIRYARGGWARIIIAV